MKHIKKQKIQQQIANREKFLLKKNKQFIFFKKLNLIKKNIFKKNIFRKQTEPKFTQPLKTYYFN